MTTTATNLNAASPAQLRYVKRLAEQAGQTVALPHSRQQASALIGQLRATISQGGGTAEREVEADRDRQAVIATCAAALGTPPATSPRRPPATDQTRAGPAPRRARKSSAVIRSPSA